MQFDQLRQREVRALLGAVLTWPLAARAQQQSAMPVIGYFGIASPDLFASRVRAFH